MKKFFIIVCIGIALPILASGFLPFAEYLADHGIITRQTDVSGYRLNDLVLRQEVAAMAFRLRGFTSSESYSCRNVFQDITAISPNTWVCQVVEKNIFANIVSNQQTNFRPEAAITRAEALAMLMGGICLSFRDTVIADIPFSSDTADWQKPLIATAHQFGVTSHIETFRPNDTATRGEIFVFARNLHQLSLQNSWCEEFTWQLISAEAQIR